VFNRWLNRFGLDADAIEESVAYDVYHEVGGDYERRRRWMLRMSTAFITAVSVMHVRHMARDGLFSLPGYVAKRALAESYEAA
jgi:predicted metal-dependent hydrolase